MSTADCCAAQGAPEAGPAPAQRVLFRPAAPAAAPTTNAAVAAMPGQAAAQQREAGRDSSCAAPAADAQPLLACTDLTPCVPLAEAAAMVTMQTPTLSGAPANQDAAATLCFSTERPDTWQSSCDREGEQPAEPGVSKGGPLPAAGLQPRHLPTGEAAGAGKAAKDQPGAQRMQGLGAPVRVLACSRSETMELPQRTTLRSEQTLPHRL